jgi:hypothetical protein
LRSLALTPWRLVRYPIAMIFEQALKDGELDTARAILDEFAELPDTGGLWLPECYGELAQSYDRRGRHDDAIAAQERAIALGWGGRPDPRSDIAEFHLRAGVPPGDLRSRPGHRNGEEIPVALAWYSAGEYERAL